MYRFWETIVKPLIEMIDAKSVLEIGAQNGYTTQKIIDYMCFTGGKAQSIDPAPNFDYKLWEKESDFSFKMHLGLSLEILPELPPFDAYLIDGDHNWYTVYNELKYIAFTCKRNDILIILHDIGWPYDRRDLYYNPQNIPEEYRNPYEKKGIKYGVQELQNDGINGELCNAVSYGTPHNGVLTAIEDFIRENPEYEFTAIDCCNGLGIIKKKRTFETVFDYVNNTDTLKALLKQTEEDRLKLFQERYTYKNKFNSTMNSLKNLKAQYEETNAVLQEEREEAKKQYMEFQQELMETRAALERDNQILRAEAENVNQKYNNLEQEFFETRTALEKENQTLRAEAENVNQKYNNLEQEFFETRAALEKDNQILQEKELETNNKYNQLQQEFFETRTALERDIQILREEGRKSRKQSRDLQKELQSIYESRAFNLAINLSKMYHSPGKLYLFLMRKGKQGFKHIKTSSLSQNDITEEHTAEKNTAELITDGEPYLYPSISEYDKQSIYDQNAKATTVSLVVCIHNALNDVIECLNSIWLKRTFPYEIILIDDGSDDDTMQYVKKFAELTGCKLHRNEDALGYTKSANIGLRMSDSDYVILLNSDTIVTDSWVEKMLTCFEKNTAAGIVSPLSNAASYQSVPEIKDPETGDWKINVLNDDMTIDMMGLIVEKVSQTRYPQVTALNGFCFMISRAVINTIGYLDEVNFPRGYGEEVDYCIRAASAGFELRVVDDTYIFHEKSKSFTHKTRKELGAASKPILKEKHGEDVYLNVGKSMESCAELQTIRTEIKDSIEKYHNKCKNLSGKKIAFVLTAKGGSGGANSVCQETAGMRNLGIEVDIINSLNYKKEFTENYPEISQYVKYFDKKSHDSFIQVACKYDVLIATIFTTVNLVQIVKEKYPRIKIGYYVQDYEPFFFDRKEAYFQTAKQSYTQIPDMFLFAKTKWIADTVQKYHNVKVNLVEPSIDTRLYNPFVIRQKSNKNYYNICAMVRPKTSRRNPKGTMEVLLRLKKRYGSSVHIFLFGCSDEEIKNLGSYDFEYLNLGILKRWEVAKLLAVSDMFLDMSTYQAFGRTGLESMCLGCMPILPIEGGVAKFARDNENAIIVNTGDVNEVYTRISAVLDMPQKMAEMQQEGINTSKSFNVQNAAWSEIQLLNSILE